MRARSTRSEEMVEVTTVLPGAACTRSSALTERPGGGLGSHSIYEEHGYLQYVRICMNDVAHIAQQMGRVAAVRIIGEDRLVPCQSGKEQWVAAYEERVEGKA